MTSKLTKEYFENRKQQGEIKLAIMESIPRNVYYHNLIIALAEILHRMVEASYQEDVFTKVIPPADKDTP